MLTVTWIASRIIEPATQFANTAQQILASALYYQNWQLAPGAVNYFKSGNAATPVQHCWSLPGSNGRPSRRNAATAAVFRAPPGGRLGLYGFSAR